MDQRMKAMTANYPNRQKINVFHIHRNSLE